jgi:oligopeptide/dipeptide ABC transporter ATP-binding protein
MRPDGEAVVDVSGLTVTTESEPSAELVTRVSLQLRKGEMVGLVGESGSGKTTMAMAIAELLPPGIRRTAGTVRVLGQDLDALSPRRRGDLLGRGVALVFQDPSASLNPVRRVGPQMIESIRFHGRVPKREALARAASRLRDVGIEDPERVLRSYPDMLSGGMTQRVVIAMGLLADPAVLIADEPTTALDVRVQASVLELLAGLNRDAGVAVLLVSHNIAAVAAHCHRVLVMYAGTIVEELPTAQLADAARHPYTRALVGSVPTLGMSRGTELPTIPGSPPDPFAERVGCPFAARCPAVLDRCRDEMPPMVELAPGHAVACWAVHQEPAARNSDTARGVAC